MGVVFKVARDHRLVNWIVIDNKLYQGMQSMYLNFAIKLLRLGDMSFVWFGLANNSCYISEIHF